ERMAAYGDADAQRLLANPGIVRNRLKVAASITNARQFMAMRERGESFSDLLWGFVDGHPIQNHWASLDQVPSSTAQSQAMSKTLKKRGFKFVGDTICYAFMQAVGMVNDHTTDCPRHAECARISQG
ncbi:MAG: DNA-3-methyladenine glycosylase I, partial [Gammaproteobacteria bacterium]